MGAKVEGESYNPGYYATGDLHMDSNGWRSPYYEDKTSNGQLCNGFMTKQADSYSECHNEMLKRTMLSHEAMFRQQVYELHRVYKIQRDLMKHYENKETYAYPILADSSQTNSSSQVPPNGTKMIWQMQMPLVAKTYGEATVAVHNDTNHSLKFLNDGNALPSPNGFPSNGVALNTKQGTIDLELPADHYIDDENTSDSKPIDFFGVDSDAKPPNDAAVTFSRAEGFGRFSDNSSTSGLLTTNKPGGCHVADLNEPITGMHMGGTSGSVSRGLSYTLENSWRQSAVRSSATNFGFNKEYSKEKHTVEGTSSNFLDASVKLRQEEKPLIDKGKQVSSRSFFTPRHSNADLQKSFKVADGRSATNEFIYHGQNSSVGWFSKGPMGASAVNNFARLDHPHHSSIGTLVAPISIPHMDHPSVASPIGSCTVDPRSSVINNAAFQRVPSFNGSSTVNSYKSPSAVTGSIGPSIHKLKRFDNLDGSYFGFPLDPFSASRSRQQVAISSELEQNNCLMFEHSARQSHGYPQSANGKCTKNFNLNEALSDGTEELVEQNGRSVGSLQHSKGEGSVFGISWLKNKPTCADPTPTGLEKQRKVFGHSNGTATDEKNNTDLTGTTPIVCNLSDSASTSLGCRIKIDEPSEGITDRTWLVCNKTHESTTRHLPFSSQKPLDRDGQAAEGVIKKSGAVIRNLFDLNDDVPHEDNSESSVVSHECDVASLQNNHAKRTFLIDLEVPACEDGAVWASQQECTPSGKLDTSKEADMCFTSATDAAEIILALSTDVPTTTGTPDDMLQWFAELAISSTDAHAEKAEAQGCIYNSSDDGSDSFEALTLKLEESKTDERWTSTLAPTLTDDEQAVSTVNLLLSKPKRGPQRKRRQKRDFQKDILPGLSSLSRPKIIEDIQLIEGLVQASGGSWESSLTRRARGGRTRGRKPKSQPATVEIETEASPPSKPDSIGLEADERGMVGWGRTTRRCRKPRCPSGNNVASSS